MNDLEISRVVASDGTVKVYLLVELVADPRRDVSKMWEVIHLDTLNL